MLINIIFGQFAKTDREGKFVEPKFDIPKGKKDEMAEAIRGYFETERGEDIGNLAAMMLLDFIMEEIAPAFYNLGVEDSRTYLNDKLDDMYGIMR